MFHCSEARRRWRPTAAVSIGLRNCTDARALTPTATSPCEKFSRNCCRVTLWTSSHDTMETTTTCLEAFGTPPDWKYQIGSVQVYFRILTMLMWVCLTVCTCVPMVQKPPVHPLTHSPTSPKTQLLCLAPPSLLLWTHSYLCFPSTSSTHIEPTGSGSQSLQGLNWNSEQNAFKIK